MLTTATQQRNSQGNPQSETPPISIETSPIAPIIDAARIFSLRFTARMKRISAILIMSVLMVFLAACAGGGGGGGGAPGGDTTSSIGVLNLKVIPDATNATLTWNNPNANITQISISYKNSTAANFTLPIPIMDEARLARNIEVREMIPSLTSNTTYTFRVALELGGADENKTVIAREITRLIGPNLDGDEYADADPLELDIDGDNVNNTMDAFPLDPTEDTDTDNDTVGDNADAFPRNASLSAFTVSELRAAAGDESVTLRWNNPNAQIASIDISYKRTGTSDAPMTISSSQTTSGAQNEEETITGLTNGQSYNFTVSLILGDTDASKEVEAQSISATPDAFAVTGLYGIAGDSYVTLSWNNPDAQIESISISYQVSGDPDSSQPALPIVPSSKFAANASVQHNISGLTPNTYYDFTVSLILGDPDTGKEGAPPSIRNILVNPDYDGDGKNNFVDVDADGDGLIEIATAQQFNQSRHNLLGSNFTRSAGGVGNANGCGGMEGVIACNGYELIADIYLTTYANWQPIGRCIRFTNGNGACSPTTELFNAIFDGNSHTINDFTITNPAGSYANEVGLFGAIGSDSILRNIHIRSGNISGGGRNVGLLVGYARGAMIINSSAVGAVKASGYNVGGLVGYGVFATITSSYAAGGDVSGTGNNVGPLPGDNVGGLVGDGSSSIITSSYAAGGAVSGDFSVGGLVGDGTDATITSSYAAGGAVSGHNGVGGLVGYGANLFITSSYAVGGAVNGRNNVGGLVGNGLKATITFSYWDSEKSGITSSSGGISKTTSELQAPVHATGIYATWTSSCPGTNKPTWYFGNSTQYPVLTCHPNSDSDRDGVPDIIDTDDDGDGTLDTADAFPLNPTESVDTDNDGVGNNTDAFPADATESVDTDGDRVGDNADACDGVGAATDWTSDATTDKDGDGCRDSDEDAFPSDPNESVDTDGDGVGNNADVDADGDGLIEIATAQQLNQSRHNLLGSNFTRSAGGIGDTNGCGNGTTVGEDVTACNGYELIADIYLTTYTNWQPIGRCTTSAFDCTPVNKLFNAIFDGNNHTINDLTITNPAGSYANAAGLFGAISSTSILRNIHIRSGNISDGGHNVGLLVGYARGEDDNIRPSIINSSAEGAVDASGDNVGGLVGFGRLAEITSSYAAGGAVSGGEDVGGLVGDGDGATITSSYAAGGAVSGTGNDVGGLVGSGGDRAEITSSYAAGGAVSGGDNVGGLVGNGRRAIITSSYAAGGAVSGGNAVGGLVGSTSIGDGQRSIITSSYAAGGAVSGTGDDVGGLVGYGERARITSSYAAGGAVSGGSSVGGLVGYGQQATITSSYAAGGNVSGGNAVGGLVGYGFLSTITSSYAAGGSVSGGDNVGGLVGRANIGSGDVITITASYWDREKSGQTSSGGGEAKTTNELQAPVHATGIYATWTNSCPGTNKPAWYFGTSTQYPVLTCHPNSDSDRDGVPDIIDTDDDGDGTLDTADDLPLNPTEKVDTDNDGVGNNADVFPTDATESANTDNDDIGDNADNCPLVPNNGQDDFDNDMVGDACDIDTNGNGLIEIATAQQLNQSRYNLQGSSFKISATAPGNANGCGGQEGIAECNGYELTNDISLADYADWQPIGSCPTYASSECTDTAELFSATFHGNDRTISNLTITNSNGDYDNAAGLFGAISSTSVLRNIHIRSANITGGVNNAGLLVGYARSATINNSSVEGDVAASGDNVGGLVGDGFGAMLTSSYAESSFVSGHNNVGGMVGYGQGATITSSYAVSGTMRVGFNVVGGLVGNGVSATITSSYAVSGTVSGAYNAGGLVGLGASATITSSYAISGTLSIDNNNVGGLVAHGDGATITSSYAVSGAVSGGNNVGGLVGLGDTNTMTPNSYWDNSVTIMGPADTRSYGLPQTTNELQTTRGNTGIYATWTSSCPGTNKPAWYFGTSTQYPVLTCHPNSDSDRDGVPDITDTDDDGDGTLDTADALPLNPTEDTDTDNDGVGNNTDAFPSDPNESVDTDNDGVGDNADNCPLVLNNGQDDFDNDMVGDACDVDADGNGLIEIATAQQLNQSRYNLQGSSFKISATAPGNANGCGGQEGIAECNGYELTNDISLADYADWQPIGSCPTYASSECTDTAELFSATFHGNDRTISNLTITNSNGDYDNAAGLFGAISSTSILRNIHIRSGNISGGGHNVGLLVGYARGAMIINSSAEGAVNASGNNVGGLVGDGQNAEITSSYAAGGAVSGDDNVGGLVGAGRGSSITSSYAAGGAVSGNGDFVGGLVGDGVGAEITSSYAAGGDVSGANRVGGLVGFGNSATITSSYAADGSVSGHNGVGGLVGDGASATITSSYAAGGAVSGANNVGGLVGFGGGARITFSYWDDAVTITPSTGNSYGLPKTTSELQAPVHATGIYATWTSSCPGANKPAWYFGNSTQYPVLTCHPNSDSDRDGVPDITDTDDDNDGTLDTADDLPLNPTERVDTDNDGVGDNADAFPTDGTLSAFAVTGLKAAAGDESVTLSWNNPNAQIASINISYKRTGTNDAPMTISSTQTTSGAPNVEETITDLTNGQSYTFTVSLTLMDPDASKEVEAQSVRATATANPFAVTGLYGVAGADYVTLSWNNPDAQIESISISHQVSGPGNPEESSLITDSPEIGANETVQHNISGLAEGVSYDFTVSLILSDPDAGKEGAPPTIRVRVNPDHDEDGVDNFADVDANGNGLIEIATAQQLNQSRHNLLGSSFTRSAGGVGDANGCGNGESVTECNGYELIADIYLTTYANWQPIGGCPTLSSGRCADLDALFNAIFDGNNHTINDLTITNPAGSYANASGLFGAISSTSILRNIHIRSANISDGGHNVGLLVGYARGENVNIRPSIINSAAEGAVNASGDHVGGLVGYARSVNITSSYASGGAVSGANFVGGLVGRGFDATITSSYAAGGAVSGANFVGGLVGFGRDAEITSSYAAGGAVSGDFSVGGLVGDGRGVTIRSSYAAGGAVSGGSRVGGLVGWGADAISRFSYWDDAVTITGSIGGSYGSSQTTSALQTPTEATGIYSTWAEDTCADGTTLTWDFGTASQYPALNCTPNGLSAQEHLRQR